MVFYGSSIAVNLLRNGYSAFESLFFRSLENSLTFRISEGFCRKTRDYSRYSFFAKANSFLGRFSSGFTESVLARQIKKIGKWQGPFFQRYFKPYLLQSRFCGFALELKDNLRGHFARAGGTVLFTATATDTALTLLLRNKVYFSGWCFRAIFLLLGLGGLFSSADWQAVKSDSLFLRAIFKPHVRDLRQDKP
jgi:hypothetical protein